MLLYKNRKNSWLTALGNFDDMQNHCELPMKNNITSKYLWKHSILYPFPMIFDIEQKVHLVIPMEKIRAPKKHIARVHNWLQLRRTKKKWSVIERHQQWKERHEKSPFYHSETLFFLQFNDPDWRPLGEPPPPAVYIYIYLYITLEYSNPLTNREYEEFRLWDSFNMAHMHRLCPSCSYTSAKSWRGMPLPEFSWGTVLRNPGCRRFWRDSGLKMSEKGKPSKIVCKSISHWF